MCVFLSVCVYSHAEVEQVFGHLAINSPTARNSKRGTGNYDAAAISGDNIN